MRPLKNFFIQFWRVLSAVGGLLGILFLAKDASEVPDALNAWLGLRAMINQNTALWFFAIITTAYIGWIDLRPIWRRWRKPFSLKVHNSKRRVNHFKMALYMEITNETNIEMNSQCLVQIEKIVGINASNARLPCVLRTEGQIESHRAGRFSLSPGQRKVVPILFQRSDNCSNVYYIFYENWGEEKGGVDGVKIDLDKQGIGSFSLEGKMYSSSDPFPFAVNISVEDSKLIANMSM